MPGGPWSRESLDTLVRELDLRLDPKPDRLGVSGDPVIIAERRFHVSDRWRLPTFGLASRLAVIALGLVAIAAGGGGLALQSALDVCRSDGPVCQIEHVDIDAVLLTAPEAELFDLLPTIDRFDPHDRLTLGEVLRLDPVSELDPDTLISAHQVARVLDHLE